MSVCPNCGNEYEENAGYCEKCGNPIGDERPWDKPTVSRPDAPPVDRGPKVKHQVRKSSKRARYLSTMEREWYLEGEFVIKVGYCGYTENPENHERFREGTAILTKNALLFGDSEHSIRCGKYVLEIPLDVIEYITDSRYRDKPAFLIKLVSGEELIMYVMKKKDWIEYFEYVLDYRQTDTDVDTDIKDEAGKDGIPFWERWGKALLYLLVGVAFFVWSMYNSGLIHIVSIFIFICCGFLVAVAIFAPDKLKR